MGFGQTVASVARFALVTAVTTVLLYSGADFVVNKETGNGLVTGTPVLVIRSGSGGQRALVDVLGNASFSGAIASKLLPSCTGLSTTSTGMIVCGAAAAGGGTGITIVSGDARYVNVAGDTMTGALTVRVLNSGIGTLGLKVTSTLTGGIIHGERAVTSSGTMTAVSSITAKTVLSGASLAISGNGAFSGSVFVKNNLTAKGVLSGSSLAVSGNGAFSGSLVAKNAFSGSSIFGFNLVSCNNATTSKIMYNNATGKFGCGTDQNTGGGSGFGTGNVLTIGDSRYLKLAGGTLTGAVTSNITNGNINTIGIKVINTLSGAQIHAEGALTVTGTTILRTLRPALTPFSVRGATSQSVDLGQWNTSTLLVGKVRQGGNQVIDIATANTAITITPNLLIGGGNFTNSAYYSIAMGFTGNFTDRHSPVSITAITTSNAGETHAGLGFYTRNVTSNTAPTLRMFVAPNGNVSIGSTATTNPRVTLAVSGSGDIAGTLSGYSLRVGGSGNLLTGMLSKTATLNFASQVAVGCEELTVDVPQAADGDVCAVGVPSASAVTNGIFTCRVSSANTVSVKHCNVISGDPASGAFKIAVFKFP